MSNIILTGDRPTGNLHLGHFVGSISNRVRLQNEGNYDKMYIMIADSQALTDNFDNPSKVRENVLNVLVDYLSCGLDPNKVTFFIQSEVSELTELTFYYMNLVSVSRLKRNPTIKNELGLRGFESSIPTGFMCYPISQAADITAFNANIIPVGDDQLPMIEQTNEIVERFNSVYNCNALTKCEAVLPESEYAKRLPGIDGVNKMSKSLGNCIYLKDDSDTVKKQVMKMYTDPNHININDPGKVEGNVVFIYLEALCNDEHFKKYYPEFNNLDELKKAYEHGGIGDVKIKMFLYNVIEEILTPIRKRREELLADPDQLMTILKKGTEEARIEAKKTVKKVKQAMLLDYFE